MLERQLLSQTIQICNIICFQCFNVLSNSVQVVSGGNNNTLVGCYQRKCDKLDNQQQTLIKALVISYVIIEIKTVHISCCYTTLITVINY